MIRRTKANPFQKYLKREDLLTIAVFKFIRLQYPKAIAIHVPNEGRRTKFEQYYFKQLGGMAGISDVIIFEPKGQYHGLVMELKVGRNKVTDNQQQFLNRMEEKGYYTCVVYDSAAKAAKIINDYMKKN